ncbi:MAG: C4-dicarboxylate ABC transporter, partial [Clostridia bacterium]|nr:C4-dicarboxylate ABC transporter [Clostridia bacterium]
NNDYVTFAFTLQTLITWLSGIVICYSLAIMLQGYVEQKITVFERIAYLGIIALTIVPSPLYSIIGIALFIALYGFRVRQGKKMKPAAAA